MASSSSVDGADGVGDVVTMTVSSGGSGEGSGGWEGDGCC